MKLKLVAVLLTVCMLAGVFCACGGTDNSDDVAAEVYGTKRKHQQNRHK